MAAAIDWRVFCIIFAIFVVTVALTRYVSLGSVLSALAFGVCFCCFYWGNWTVCALAVAAALFVTFRHRANIVRLFHHSESKLSFHKKKE